MTNCRIMRFPQINWRMSDDEVTDATPEEWRDPAIRASTRCRIFLSFTSNLISAGTREQFKYLVRQPSLMP